MSSPRAAAAKCSHDVVTPSMLGMAKQQRIAAVTPLQGLLLLEVGAGEAAAVEEHAEAVVVAVAEAAGDGAAAVEFDRPLNLLCVVKPPEACGPPR